MMTAARISDPMTRPGATASLAVPVRGSGPAAAGWPRSPARGRRRRGDGVASARGGRLRSGAVGSASTPPSGAGLAGGRRYWLLGQDGVARIVARRLGRRRRRAQLRDVDEGPHLATRVSWPGVPLTSTTSPIGQARRVGRPPLDPKVTRRVARRARRPSGRAAGTRASPGARCPTTMPISSVAATRPPTAEVASTMRTTVDGAGRRLERRGRRGPRR